MIRIIFFVFLISLQFKVYAQVSSYTVIKGDTLWDISQKNYKNPYLWPSVWDVNKSTVTNPDIIYPGQMLSIPSLEDAKKMAPAVVIPSIPSQVEKVADIKPLKTLKTEEAVVEENIQTNDSESEVSMDAINESQIAVVGLKEEKLAPAAEFQEELPDVENVSLKKEPEDALSEAKIVNVSFKPDGTIVGMKGAKLLISQGDIVYISVDPGMFSKGDRLSIYRKSGKVEHPERGKKLGVELIKIGLVEILEKPSAGACAARVLRSSEPVGLNDWVIKEPK